MGIGEWIGGAAKGVVEGIATPFSNAWIKTKESAAATHKVDRETDRDITIESYRADVQLAMGQRLLAESDRTHWSTRWIRPGFAGLAFVWMAWSVWLWIAHDKPLDEVVKYLLAGIVGAIFVLRPFEKNKRSDIVAKAQAAPVPPPGKIKSLINRRADDA